ncbi:transcription factor apfi protein, putative (macronuclear) [Tetrahymena thermophila SB210]|uniref:Transcription factor apfi protein, putative n=1 Tax=Tetrahymena thermophila (strain SB210) TaxID=312017 RepID=I7M8Q7_TETTS|nr:transcription factor apfi protein, putative [Tetrahymena thermophila SB210]7TGH_C3 Chain C3, Transcription factor apfi protein, putative [Tetrahymena thermophila]8B6F_AG Chain AG, Transcription factor apfi protein, putative [Tetrahymena thermophila SB210]8BQS_AG Chain AG, Transcription factor apfi protein, putative [Tetrahymena thermophila SB210]8GYM_G3 Chain G3, Transcription factor apfi protein, putative [Tetrahymena thermophila SB210]8GYM_g3 Chain g3, Transcription factor apfi protein, p|eukprot:XP_001019725.2 transcription factor apfi protein, putative [Tetrahymena thermophila SB210]
MLRLRLFDAYEKISMTFLGPLYRRIGKSLAQTGLNIQQPYTSDDRLVPSLRNIRVTNKIPSINDSEFIAPNSVVIGDVITKEGSSIWYGATLRGELGPIEIGKQTVIQDLVNIQSGKQNQKTQIGDNVFIGPNSYIQSSKINDNSFVGMGSTVSTGCNLASNAVVAAGSVVPENTQVPSNQIWAGSPAQYLRDITPEERQVLQEHHQECVQLARIHAEETEKSFREVLNDFDRITAEAEYDHESLALQKMRDLGFPMEGEEEEYIEQRVFMREQLPPLESEFWKKNYDPYEQDLFHFPDSFKAYQQQYKRYDEAKKYFEENPNVEATIIDREFKEPTNKKPWTRKY